MNKYLSIMIVFIAFFANASDVPQNNVLQININDKPAILVRNETNENIVTNKTIFGRPVGPFDVSGKFFMTKNKYYEYDKNDNRKFYQEKNENVIKTNGLNFWSAKSVNYGYQLTMRKPFNNEKMNLNNNYICNDCQKFYPENDYIYDCKDKIVCLVFNIDVEFTKEEEQKIIDAQNKITNFDSFENFKKIRAEIYKKVILRYEQYQFKFSNDNRCVFDPIRNYRFGFVTTSAYDNVCSKTREAYFLSKEPIKVSGRMKGSCNYYIPFCGTTITQQGIDKIKQIPCRPAAIPNFFTVFVYFPTSNEVINYGKLMIKKTQNNEWENVKIKEHYMQNWKSCVDLCTGNMASKYVGIQVHLENLGEFPF